MINAQYFTDSKGLRPVPQLVFHNYPEGYWKEWYVLGWSPLDDIDYLLQSVSTGSLILFDDRFCGETQYAVLNEYDSANHVAEFQLLNDQLQPINAIAFLAWNADDSHWCMRIESACLYLRASIETAYPNDELILHSCKIQDGVLGRYAVPVK